MHTPSHARNHRSGAHRLRVAAALSTATVALSISACSDSDSSASTASTASTDAETTTAAADSTTTTTPVESMRGNRYCEVLIVTPVDGKVTATVYNSWPLNTCPDDLWTALDPVAIAAEYGAPLAILNGPRYWLMDSVEKTDRSNMTKASFGGIDMYLQATVDIGPLSEAMTPYKEHAVDRSSAFSYNAGQMIYELTAPTGEVYVMQTWGQSVDPSLEEADLADLGARLAPPAGWTFSSRTLTETFVIDTSTQTAYVLRDDLQNSYSRVTP